MSDSGLTFFKLFSGSLEFLAVPTNDTHRAKEAESQETHARRFRYSP